MTDPFYSAVIRTGPALLLLIAAVNLIGSLGLTFASPTPGGVLFKVSAAFSSTLIPLIAASVLLRFDQWFTAGRRGDFE